MGKRFCRECGCEMGEDEKFCRSCGTPVDSADAKEETVGQKVDNSIEDVKNKISSGKSGSKLNIKIIVPIVAIIVIIFLAWAVTSAFSGHDIELDGQKFHIGSKYYKNDTMAQKFANNIADFQPSNVVCYVDATSHGDYGGPDYFMIVTKDVGNLTLDQVGSGKTVNINGKECLVQYYQTTDAQWVMDNNHDWHVAGYDKLPMYTYIDDGVYVSVVFGPNTDKELINEIIK